MATAGRNILGMFSNFNLTADGLYVTYNDRDGNTLKSKIHSDELGYAIIIKENAGKRIYVYLVMNKQRLIPVAVSRDYNYIGLFEDKSQIPPSLTNTYKTLENTLETVQTEYRNCKKSSLGNRLKRYNIKCLEVTGKTGKIKKNSDTDEIRAAQWKVLSTLYANISAVTMKKVELTRNELTFPHPDITNYIDKFSVCFTSPKDMILRIVDYNTKKNTAVSIDELDMTYIMKSDKLSIEEKYTKLIEESKYIVENTINKRQSDIKKLFKN